MAKTMQMLDPLPPLASHHMHLYTYPVNTLNPTTFSTAGLPRLPSQASPLVRPALPVHVHPPPLIPTTFATAPTLLYRRVLLAAPVVPGPPTSALTATPAVTFDLLLPSMGSPTARGSVVYTPPRQPPGTLPLQVRLVGPSGSTVPPHPIDPPPQHPPPSTTPGMSSRTLTPPSALTAAS